MKKALILSLILPLIFLSGCLLLKYATARPHGKAIDNNKKLTALIPILRNDAPLFIEKLEILRLGLAVEKKYIIYTGIPLSYGYQIGLSDGHKHYNFMEWRDQFSHEELETINYLLFSDELQLNAQSIFFDTNDLWKNWGVAFPADGRYELKIRYYETDKDLEYLQRNGDYWEKLYDNYWIVLWYMPMI